jgi:hypothetical protein
MSGFSAVISIFMAGERHFRGRFLLCFQLFAGI